jgi:hypothetical protein
MYNILIDGQNLKVEDKLERGNGYYMEGDGYIKGTVSRHKIMFIGPFSYLWGS